MNRDINEFQDNPNLYTHPEFTIENNEIKGKKIPLEVSPHGLGHYILQNLEEAPDTIGIINTETDDKYTFAKIRDLSVRCALWLLKENVKQGDMVSLFSYNRLDTIIPYLATLYTGAIFAPMNYGISSKSAEYFIELITPKIIFVTEDSYDTVHEAIKNVKAKTKIVVLGHNSNVQSLDDIIKIPNHEEVKNFTCSKIDSVNQTAVILFSSGTTGLPKGVELSHQAILKSIMRYEDWVYDESISLWYSTVSWISGAFHIVNSIAKKATKIHHPNFDPDETCKILEKYKVTYVLLSSTMLYKLHKANVIQNYDLSNLKELMTTGSRISTEVINHFVKELPHVFVKQAYGMTELGGLITFPSTNKSKKHSIGTVTYNVDLKVVDPVTNEILGANKPGEFYFRSPYLMNGYYKNNEATISTVDFNTGWVRSGDKGYYDDEGYIYAIDRLKEILKVESQHVSPVEIEHVLMQHPGIEEAVVAGVPHPADIDHPIAFVKRSPNSQITEQEVLDLAATLGYYHTLRAGVVFVDSLPQTASNKIDRKRIREMARSYAKI